MVAVMARTGVCVDCVCVDVEVVAEEEGGGAGAPSLPRKEPPVGAFANSVASMLIIHK
jgi:hypothetical protein